MKNYERLKIVRALISEKKIKNFSGYLKLTVSERIDFNLRDRENLCKSLESVEQKTCITQDLARFSKKYKHSIYDLSSAKSRKL